jgi:5'-nucleotidase/UDP-sugar diphosphatase
MNHRSQSKIPGMIVFILGFTFFCQAQTRTLTILHANDTHSNMFPFGADFRDQEGRAARGTNLPGPKSGLHSGSRQAFGPDSGGIARMSTLIRRLRTENKHVLALHAGDVFVGSFEFNKYLGYPELRIMEGLYDAMALGNHEFDLGLAGLSGVLGGETAGDAPVELPVLCANINFAGTPLESVVKASIIKTVGGIRVGIFGLVTEDPQHYTPEVTARSSGRITEVAASQVATLRGSGCEVVVCLSHLGATADVFALSKVEGIDIIVGGHSHDVLEKPILRNGKIIVQAGMFGLYLGELRIKIGGGKVALDRYRLHRIDGKVREDPRLRGRLNALREGIVEDPRFGPVYTRRVAWANEDIEKRWPGTGPFRDTPLGNLVTDAVMAGLKRAGVRADFALEALGYIASQIPRGKISENDVLRAVPYGYDPETGLGYKIVIVPLTGSLILGGLEYALSKIPYTKDLCMQASGLTYDYDSTKPPSGQLGVLSRLDPLSVLANGEPVAAHPAKTYLVAMSEQVFNFLDALAAPAGITLTSIPTGLSEYTLVRDFLRELGTVDAVSEGRIRDVVRPSSGKLSDRRAG